MPRRARARSHLELQLQAMRLCANLTSSGGHGIECILKGGCVPTAVYAMASHYLDEGVMWLGARVLANVAETAEGVLKICEAGGATAVVIALEVHTEEAELYAEGCRALANLAFADGEKPGEARVPTWREVGRSAVEAALTEQAIDKTEDRASRLRLKASMVYAAYEESLHHHRKQPQAVAATRPLRLLLLLHRRHHHHRCLATPKSQQPSRSRRKRRR